MIRKHPFIQIIIISFTGLILPAQVNWISSFDEAKEIASRENKFIVIDISASWCGPCQKMAREVYSDPEFIAFTKDNVYMLVDEEKDNEGIVLSRRFNIHSFPTILVLNSKGEEIDRLSGGRDTKTLIKDLQNIFNYSLPKAELRKQAELEFSNFELQKTAGLRAFDRHNFEEAEKYLSRAAKLADKDDPATVYTVYMFLAHSQFKEEHFKEFLESMDIMGEILPLSINTKEFAILKAMALINLERNDEAYSLLNDLLKSPELKNKADIRAAMQRLPKKYRKDLETVEKQNKKTTSLIDKNKFLEAESLVNNSLELAPDNTESLLLSAGIQVTIAGENPADPEAPRRMETALRQTRMALRLAPGDYNVYQDANKRHIYSQASYKAPRNPDAFKEFAKAEEEFTKGNFEKAVKHYLKVMELEPQFSKTYLNLGDCFYLSKQFDQALKLYEQAIALAPVDPAGYRFAADIYFKLGQTDKCREYLLKSVKADPSYPTVWDYMDKSKLWEKGIERHYHVIPTKLLLCQSQDDYDSLLEYLPARTLPAWRAYVDKKLSYENRERQPGTIYWPTAAGELECLKELVAAWSTLKLEDRTLQDPDLDFIRQVSIDGHLDSFVYLELYFETYRPEFEAWKKINEAKIDEYFKNYIFDIPLYSLEAGQNISAIKAYNRGVVIMDSNKEEAIACFQKALWQDPHMMEAMQNLSVLLANSKRYEEAREVTERWMGENPDSLAAVSQLGFIFLQSEQYADAVGFLEEILARKPLKDDSMSAEQLSLTISNLEGMLEFCKMKLGKQ